MSKQFALAHLDPSTAGYFGKIPDKGDFIMQGLPRSFLEPWDAWMQEMLLTSRKHLQKRWLDIYLTSPIYRFALAPGICGEQAWLGVVMPSVDRVGRYYPMTVCQAVTVPCNTIRLFQRNEPWFNQAEALILSCLDDDFSLSDFQTQLQGLGVDTSECVVQETGDNIPTLSPDDDSATVLKTSNPDEKENTQNEAMKAHPADKHKPQQTAFRYPIPEATVSDALCTDILDRLLHTFCASYSVWWTQGSERVETSFLLSQGLPPFAGATALLDGHWQHWGWQESKLPVNAALDNQVACHVML